MMSQKRLSAEIRKFNLTCHSGKITKQLQVCYSLIITLYYLSILPFSQPLPPYRSTKVRLQDLLETQLKVRSEYQDSNSPECYPLHHYPSLSLSQKPPGKISTNRTNQRRIRPRSRKRTKCHCYIHNQCLCHCH